MYAFLVPQTNNSPKLINHYQKNQVEADKSFERKRVLNERLEQMNKHRLHKRQKELQEKEDEVS